MQIQLQSTWCAIVTRMAVISASAVALVSLIVGSSVSAASLRGGGVWLGLSLFGFCSRWLLQKSFPDLSADQTPYEFDPRDLV